MENLKKTIHGVLKSRLYVLAARDKGGAHAALLRLGHLFELENDDTRVFDNFDAPTCMTGEEIDKMAREYKLMARANSAPVVMITRLVTADSPKRPVMTDLPGTYEVEAHADVIIVLHGDALEPIVIKNRHGRVSPLSETEKGYKVALKR